MQQVAERELRTHKDVVVLNDAVERDQNRARVRVNDSNVRIWSGKPLDGFHRIPERLNDELDADVIAATQEICAAEAWQCEQTW